MSEKFAAQIYFASALQRKYTLKDIEKNKLRDGSI